MLYAKPNDWNLTGRESQRITLQQSPDDANRVIGKLAHTSNSLLSGLGLNLVFRRRSTGFNGSRCQNWVEYGRQSWAR